MLSQLFGIDLRSLALMRISLALIGLWDLALRSRDLSVFYTDAGAFPRLAAVGYYSDRFVASLHMMSGATAFQAGLFLIAAAALLCMLVGYRTRLAVAVAWILLVSLHVRTPPLLQAGDTLLRLLFFWSLFLPLGARFSVDAALDVSPRPLRGRWLSIGSAALLLQVAIMYLASALLKSGPEWRDEGSAVYYSLQLDYLVTDVGVWLRQFGDLQVVLTSLVWYFELLGPLLLFVPLLTLPLRCLMVVGFALMHLAFHLIFHIGLFPLVNLAALVPFLPPQLWDWLRTRRLGGQVRGWADRAGTWLAALSNRHLRLHATPEPRFPRLASALCLASLLYVAIWNASTLPGTGFSMPRSIRWIGELLQIEQTWDMFAPNPSRDNGWLVMPGILDSGAEVDVYRRRLESPPLRRPNHGDYFESHRWMKFIMTLARQSQEEYRVYYGRYLCRQWNTGAAGEQDRLSKLAIFFARERTLPDPQAETLEYVSLWEHDCHAPTATLHRP